jgi:hypothetical protein
MRSACVWILLCVLAGCRTGPSGRNEGATSPATKGTVAPGDELPPVDRSCSTVDDCEHSHISYEVIDGQPRCCYRCSTRPVSREWWEKASAICDRLGDEGCDEVKCKMRIPPLECVDGECMHGQTE